MQWALPLLDLQYGSFTDEGIVVEALSPETPASTSVIWEGRG